MLNALHINHCDKFAQIIRISDDAAIQQLRKKYSNGFKKTNSSENEEEIGDLAEIPRTEYEEVTIPQLISLCYAKASTVLFILSSDFEKKSSWAT